MKPFRPIRLDLLNEKERLVLLAFIINMLQETAINDSELDLYSSDFEKIHAKLHAIVEHKRAHELSEEIDQLNTLRKKLLTDIRFMLRGFLRNANEDKASAAETIQHIYDDTFSDTDSVNISELSHDIECFLEKVSTPDVVVLVSLISLDENIGLLRTTDEKYVRLYNIRAKDEGLDTTPQLLLTREEMDLVLHSFMWKLSYRVYRSEPEYTDMAKLLDSRLGAIMATARSRDTHSNHEDKETSLDEEHALHEELADIHEEQHEEMPEATEDEVEEEE